MTWATLKKDRTFDVHEGIPTLEEMQKAVGGYVEVFDVVAGDASMWCNEEAKVNSTMFGGTQTREDLENKQATILMDDAYGGPGMFAGDYIGGDVCFTGAPDEDGESTSLSEVALERIRHVVEYVRVIEPGMAPVGPKR